MEMNEMLQYIYIYNVLTYIIDFLKIMHELCTLARTTNSNEQYNNNITLNSQYFKLIRTHAQIFHSLFHEFN